MKIFILLISLTFLVPELRAQQQPVVFTAKKEKPVVGSTTQTVAISVSNFTDVTSAQFTLQWPAGTFQLAQVADFGLPNLDLSHFNVNLASSGKITFSWDDQTTQGIRTITDGTVIFRLYFTVQGPVPPRSMLQFISTPTPVEVTRLLKPASVMFSNENLSGCDCN